MSEKGKLKVAITGGTGFVGRYLVDRHLSRGDEVRVLSRQGGLKDEMHGVHWFVGDLTASRVEPEFVQDCDVLYNCAGQVTSPDLMKPLHIDGTRRLIEVATDRIGHWVQLSSVGVYGQVREGVIKEASPVRPVGLYEVTKTESEYLVLGAGKRGCFSYTILRPSNIFGVDMNNQSLYRMIAMVDKGLFLFIGERGASANYVHVENVAEALIRCGTQVRAKSEIFNLSDWCSIEQFISMIAKHLGKRAPRKRLPKWLAGFIAQALTNSRFPLTPSRVNALTNRARYDITKIQRTLGYEHIVSIDQGVRELIECGYIGRNAIKAVD